MNLCGWVTVDVPNWAFFPQDRELRVRVAEVNLVTDNPDAAAVRSVIATLAEAGADVWAKDEEGAEPLHWAIDNSNAAAATAAVHTLVAAGADVRANDGQVECRCTGQLAISARQQRRWQCRRWWQLVLRH